MLWEETINNLVYRNFKTKETKTLPTILFSKAVPSLISHFSFLQVVEDRVTSKSEYINAFKFILIVILINVNRINIDE